jgi:hypothetical protein
MFTPIELAISKSDASVAATLGTIYTSQDHRSRLDFAWKPYTTAKRMQAANGIRNRPAVAQAQDGNACANYATQA